MSKRIIILGEDMGEEDRPMEATEDLGLPRLLTRIEKIQGRIFDAKTLAVRILDIGLEIRHLKKSGKSDEATAEKKEPPLLIQCHRRMLTIEEIMKELEAAMDKTGRILLGDQRVASEDPGQT